MTSGKPLVRSARADGLPSIALPAAERAACEKATPPAPEPAGRLRRLRRLVLDTPPPRPSCLVAELPDGELVGRRSLPSAPS